MNEEMAEKILAIVREMKEDRGVKLWAKHEGEMWWLNAVPVDEVHDYADRINTVLEEGGF